MQISLFQFCRVCFVQYGWKNNHISWYTVLFYVRLVAPSEIYVRLSGSSRKSDFCGFNIQILKKKGITQIISWFLFIQGGVLKDIDEKTDTFHVCVSRLELKFGFQSYSTFTIVVSS